MNVAIIGGGAAGLFMAVTLKQLAPALCITVFEKKTKVLAKLAITGGGRCNLTNSFAEIRDLSRAYPRGDKLLKKAFRVFGPMQTYRWFEDHGVSLITQEDQCVFPRSQDANTVVNCLLERAKELGVRIRTSHTLQSIHYNTHYTLCFREPEIADQNFDLLAITTGGCPKEEGFRYLEQLGHEIIAPVPSLFTFNLPNDPIRELMGVVVDPVLVTLQAGKSSGTKMQASGALLVTHWGMSGPAILKLSAYAARIVNEQQYNFQLQVNWVNETNEEKIAESLNALARMHPQKQIANLRPYNLSSRLWLFLLKKTGISEERRWAELGKKGINKLVNTLSQDVYTVHGRGSFKDEFVTCGGVSLSSIHSHSMESKACKNLYFAGEVLDIDAITGGFNLQAAWTTAYLAAVSIHQRCAESIE